MDFIVGSSTMDPLKNLQKYQEANPLPSVIKVRLSYGKDEETHRKTLFKVPDPPVSRTDGDTSVAEEVAIEVATEEIQPDNVDNLDKPLTISSASPAEPPNSKCDSPISPTSNKEEFYKYLGIDTTPCHEKHTSNKRSTGDSISGAKRRSLRVKVQQIAMSNIAKFNKEQENKVLEAATVDKRTIACTRRSGDGGDTSKESSRSSEKRSSIGAALTIKSGESTDMEENETAATSCQSIKRRISDEKLTQKQLAKVNGSLHRQNVCRSEQNEIVSDNTDENNTMASKKSSQLDDSAGQLPARSLLIKHTYQPSAPVNPIENRRLTKQYRSICMAPQSPPVVMSPTVTSTIKQKLLAQHTSTPTEMPPTIKSSVLERRDYNKVSATSSAPLTTKTTNGSYRAKILIDAVVTNNYDNPSKRLKSASMIDCAGTIDGKSQNSETITRVGRVFDQQQPLQSTYVAAHQPMTVDSTTVLAEEMPSSSSVAVKRGGGQPGQTMTDKQKALKQLYSMRECESQQKRSMMRRKELRETIAQTKQSLRRCSHRSKKLVLSSKNTTRNFKKNASTFLKRKMSKLATLACTNRNSEALSPTVIATAQKCASPSPTPCAVTILDSGLESDAVKLSDVDQSDVPVDRTTISTIALDEVVTSMKGRSDKGGDGDDTSIVKCSSSIQYPLEDTTGNGHCRMLAVLYTNNTIITVSETFIYFWMCPSRIYTTFTKEGASHWKMIGSIDRDGKGELLNTLSLQNCNILTLYIYIYMAM